MDSDLLIIFPGVIVMLIVIGLSVNGIVSQVLSYKREKDTIQAGETQASVKGNELADRTAMIEDRLAVLERIATDRRSLLADEIDALRTTDLTTELHKDPVP